MDCYILDYEKKLTLCIMIYSVAFNPEMVTAVAGR